MVDRYLPSILYSSTVLRFGHFVMWLWFAVEFYSPEVWTLCDVIGRYLPSLLYSVTVLRFGHYVMWLVGTCHPYCLVSQLEDNSMSFFAIKSST